MSLPAPEQSGSSSLTHLDSDQTDAVARLYENDHTLLYAGMGAGKTVIALTAISELLRDGVLNRVLVVAPKKVARTTWVAEAAKWPHLQPWIELELAVGSPTVRTDALEDMSASVVVINHDSLAWAAANFNLSVMFDGLLIDESDRLANTGGVAFKKLRRHVPKFKWRACMTGTAVTEGLENLFGQMFIVDAGLSLGKRKQAFLDEFFIPVDFDRHQWAPRESATPVVIGKVGPYLHMMPDYDRGVPLVQDWAPVELPDEAMAAYQTLKRESAWEGVEAVNEAVLTGKLLQMAAGDVYPLELEDGSRDPIHVHDAKYDAMAKLIRRCDGPLLVPYWWRFQHDWLVEHGVPIFNEDEHLDAWNDGEIPVLGIHPKSCGHGLNLQYGGARLLWFGPQWSRALHDQVIARLWRRGQRYEVLSQTLIATGTMDEVARARLEGKAEWVELFNQHVRGD